MPLYDLTGEALLAHRTDVCAPADLGPFWDATLSEARGLAQPPRFEPVECGLSLVQVWDVTFSGFGGHPVKGWYRRPARANAPLPVVVTYVGYGGGRGLAHEVRPWLLAGWATLEMDTRGQGSVYRRGDTPDPVGSDPSCPGFLTRGLGDPHDHYYRRVYTDAVLAAELAAALPGADGRVVVSGASQGGALSIAAAALAPASAGIVGALVDVPFLADIPRAVDLVDDGPYPEVAAYLRVHHDRAEQAWRTLSYVDVAVLAARANGPALFSVGILDPVVPPSTVYAAYNAWSGPKEIAAYRYNEHEGGGTAHEARQLAWLQGVLGG